MTTKLHCERGGFAREGPAGPGRHRGIPGSCPVLPSAWREPSVRGGRTAPAEITAAPRMRLSSLYVQVHAYAHPVQHFQTPSRTRNPRKRGRQGGTASRLSTLVWKLAAHPGRRRPRPSWNCRWQRWADSGAGGVRSDRSRGRRPRSSAPRCGVCPAGSWELVPRNSVALFAFFVPLPVLPLRGTPAAPSPGRWGHPLLSPPALCGSSSEVGNAARL